MFSFPKNVIDIDTLISIASNSVESPYASLNTHFFTLPPLHLPGKSFQQLNASTCLIYYSVAIASFVVCCFGRSFK